MADEKMHQFVLIDSKKNEAQKTAHDLHSILDEFESSLIVFHDGGEALDYVLNSPNVSIVITEYRLEGLGGLKLIQELQEERPGLPTIMLSSSSDASIAIKSVQAGAYDFLPKPCPADELHAVISEALSTQETSTVTEKKDTFVESEPPRLIGKSRAMSKVYRDLAKLAATPVTVLIRGETGTGKELIARALHEHGHRAHKPFIAVNCAAIPDNLLESELFGHEKGSFTGASNKKIGRFEQANGATLFLDEIGDMQPLLQAKMLRVLQEKVIQRVGGTAEIPVDVRVIAATHRNLEQMVDDGAFRADLLYRLNGTTLKLPPLRDRLGDVSVLTNHFLSRFGLELGVGNPRITPEALSFLARQPWPGNIRQLQNVLRQAILKRRDLAIGAADLRPLILSDSPIIGSDTSLGKLATSILSKASKGELDHGAYREMVALAEETIITQTLQQTNGNQSQAADLLGITRYTLREKIKSLAISL